MAKEREIKQKMNIRNIQKECFYFVNKVKKTNKKFECKRDTCFPGRNNGLLKMKLAMLMPI